MLKDKKKIPLLDQIFHHKCYKHEDQNAFS